MDIRFDGDEMTFQLLTDREMEEGFEMMKVKYSALNLSAPHSVSSDLAMPKPVTATIANFLRHSRQGTVVDLEKRRRMELIFG